jgi:cell division protein FtsB
MKRTLVVATVLLAGFVATATAGGAGSAAKPTPTEKKLQAQVKSLQAQSKTLQAEVKKLQTQVKELQQVVSGSLAVSVCSAAITADALQGTWAAVNTREQATNATLPPVFATESAVNDASACTAAKVTRTPTANPPNLTAFKALLSIFQSFG